MCYNGKVFIKFLYFFPKHIIIGRLTCKVNIAILQIEKQKEEEYVMNISKFTQKSMQAIERCEKLAYEYGNQEIEQEHLLYALLTIEDSLIAKLIEKMDINLEHFLDNSRSRVEKRVKVQGGQVYVGKDLNQILIHAEDEAKQMGDEYVSVEHYSFPCCIIRTKKLRLYLMNTALQGNAFYRRCPRYAVTRR